MNCLKSYLFIYNERGEPTYTESDLSTNYCYRRIETCLKTVEYNPK